MSRSCSKSIRRTRSHRMKFCVQRGLGISPTSSVWEPSGYPGVLLSGKVSLLAGKTIVDKATRVSYNFISDTHDAENGDTIWEKKVKKPNS